MMPALKKILSGRFKCSDISGNNVIAWYDVSYANGYIKCVLCYLYVITAKLAITLAKYEIKRYFHWKKLAQKTKKTLKKTSSNGNISTAKIYQTK